MALRLPPARIGDGTQYLLTTIAFGETHRPFVTQTVMDRYNELLHREPLRQSFPAFPSPGLFFGSPIAGPAYEPHHFWFLGLLTAPFYRLTQAFGLNFARCYTLLALVLLLALALVAYRWHGASGALAVLLLVFFSPSLWFIDKAHTEFLTFTALAATLVLIDVDLLPAPPSRPRRTWLYRRC